MGRIKIQSTGCGTRIDLPTVGRSTDRITNANKLMNDTGAIALISSVGKTKALSLFNNEQSTAYNMLGNALAYQNYVIKRRESKSISATLKEARPMLEISQDELDTHKFLLNTPVGTYDLRKGTRKLHRIC